jgi:hypothetical protein
LIIALLFGFSYAHNEKIGVSWLYGEDVVLIILGIPFAVLILVCFIKKNWSKKKRLLVGIISSVILVGFGFLCVYPVIPVSSNWQPKFKISDTEKADNEGIQQENIRQSTWYTYIYFSVVTFTTLGFGDVTPLNAAGEVLLTVK